MSGPAPREGGRRALHLASGALGVVAAVASPAAGRWIFLGALAAAGVLEALRLTSDPAARALARVTGPLFRPGEARAVSGATLLAAGYALAWLLFPAATAARAITVTAVADPVAAWAGSRGGGTPGRKSVAGTAAAFVAALAVLAAWRTALPLALAGAVAAALAERIPGRGVDNVAIPLATAAALMVAG